MGGLKNIEDVDQFESMLSEATGLVVVHFTASWCKCPVVGFGRAWPVDDSVVVVPWLVLEWRGFGKEALSRRIWLYRMD